MKSTMSARKRAVRTQATADREAALAAWEEEEDVPKAPKKAAGKASKVRVGNTRVVYRKWSQRWGNVWRASLQAAVAAPIVSPAPLHPAEHLLTFHEYVVCVGGCGGGRFAV